jgi:hypothetical protein
VCLSPSQYFRAMADTSIRESQLPTRRRPTGMDARRLPVWSGRNRGLGEMTTNDLAEQGKKLFGIGVFLFGDGLVWFKWPGIFTLLPLSDRHRIFNIFHRAEIVIGVLLAAYGMLVWRSASRRLSLANYIIVLSGVPVLLLCVSKLSEWVYFLDQQSGFSILNDLAVGVIQITMVVCIVVFGGWWADSTYMHARFRGHMRSSRFVK